MEPSFSPGETEALPNGVRAGNYLLFVGDPIAERRKNFPLLYDAYRRAWPGGDGPAIVVAGARAPSLPGVIHAGEVGDDLHGSCNVALRSLYRGAIALAMPSYHETFGMPMIEAMACGAPVVASGASCLPEIGGEAASFVPPDDADAWAAALRAIVNDSSLRERLSAAGLLRARRYDWDGSAARHLEVLQTVAAS